MRQDSVAEDHLEECNTDLWCYFMQLLDQYLYNPMLNNCRKHLRTIFLEEDVKIFVRAKKGGHEQA
jgi:hypothetical protein